MLAKKKSIKIIASLLALACLSTFFIMKNANKDKDDEYIYYGSAEADKINLSAEINGKIKELKFKEGNKIKSGNLVAVIDPSESELKLQSAEIGIKSAENQLGKVQEGTRAEEIKAQEAAVRQAQALVAQGEASVQSAKDSLDAAKKNYDYRKKIYDDTAALYKDGIESKYNMDTAKNLFDNASNTLNTVNSSISSANAQLNSYKAQLDAAKEKLNLLINGATNRDKTSASYEVEKAKNSYELSKIALDKSNVISLASGTIETINYKTGEYVAPGSPIVTLLNTENMWVKIYVPEKVLPSIKLDKEVTMKSDFLEGKTIKGKISYISSEAEFTPMNIVTKKDRAKLVYGVKIKIIDNLDIVKPGMLFDVNLK